MNSHEPLVSVGIPTYNRPQGLKRTLEQISGQSYRNLEIIVSDNCSPDESVLAVADEFSKIDIRVRFFRQSTNLGAHENFKFVLREAKGVYFMWAADDDEWDPDFIRTCITSIGTCGSAMTHFNVFNRVTGEYTDIPVPLMSRNESKFTKALNFIVQLTPSLFYGLHRRESILEYLTDEAYDFADCFFVLRQILKHDYVITPILQYTAGIDSKEYEVKSFSSENGRKLEYGKFATEAAKLITTTDFGSEPWRKVYLLQALRRTLNILFIQHEASLMPHATAFVQQIETINNQIEAFSMIGTESILTMNKLVFDVGANIGAKAEKFVARGHRVVCFEPQSACVSEIQKRFAQESTVTIVNKGISDKPGTLKLAVCSLAPTISTFSPEWKRGRFSDFTWDQEIDVDVITLDQAIQEFGYPDYCKIDVEGFEPQVVRGLSTVIPLLSFEFTREVSDSARECLRHLAGLGYSYFNVSFGESGVFLFKNWVKQEEILKLLNEQRNPLFWGDIYASSTETPSGDWDGLIPHERPATPDEATSGNALLNRLETLGVWYPGTPLKVHLGQPNEIKCDVVYVAQSGEENADNWADFACDLAKLDFPMQCAELVHIDLVSMKLKADQSAFLFSKAKSWVKIGGILEVNGNIPDTSQRMMPPCDKDKNRYLMLNSQKSDLLVKCNSFVKQLDSATRWQSRSWFTRAFHKWRPEKKLDSKDNRQRDEKACTKLLIGMSAISVKEECSNLKLEIAQLKEKALWLRRQVDSATEWQSRSWFRRSFHKWRPSKFKAKHLKRPAKPSLHSITISSEQPPSLTEIVAPQQTPISTIPPHLLQFFEKMVAADSTDPIEGLLRFNQGDRDKWVQKKAKTVPAGASILDVGAGPGPYRSVFAHCSYKSHDFGQYEGYIDNREGLYTAIDYVSDITNIPVPENSFDYILCTETLEHVPEPIEALREMARILKPGGRMFLTAPAMSGLHQLPYHFYSGYTPFWYKHFCEKFGLEIIELIPNGGFFKLLAQECARVAWTMDVHGDIHGDDREAVGTLFGEVLPRFLFRLDDKCLIDQFTVGYHVEARKK